MRPNCCHVSFAFILKFLNFLQAFVGVSIILYSIWMLDQWNHHVPIYPPPIAPSPESFLSVHFNSRPEIGAEAARVFDDFVVGLASGLDNSVGFDLSSVKLPAPWIFHLMKLENLIAFDPSLRTTLIYVNGLASVS